MYTSEPPPIRKNNKTPKTYKHANKKQKVNVHAIFPLHQVFQNYGTPLLTGYYVLPLLRVCYHRLRCKNTAYIVPSVYYLYMRKTLHQFRISLF